MGLWNHFSVDLTELPTAISKSTLKYEDFWNHHSQNYKNFNEQTTKIHNNIKLQMLEWENIYNTCDKKKIGILYL